MSGAVLLPPQDRDGVRVLEARGEVDAAVVPPVLTTVPALVAEAEGLVLDLTRVTFFDSSGVRLVDALARSCADRDVPFRVAAPPRSPGRYVLEVVGFAEALAADSLADALAAVRPPG